MSNAATELADLLEEWTVPSGQTPMTVRSSDPEESRADFWRWQAHALTLVRECDRVVEVMSRSGIEVRGFSYYVDEWYAAVFSYNQGWRETSAGTTPIQPPALLALRQLSPWLSRQWGGTATAEQRHEFSNVLSQLDDLLSEIGADLSEDEQQYVLRLLSAARALLEEHSLVGDSDLRDHLDTLNGALLRAAAELSGKGKMESAKRVLEFISQLVVVAGGLVTTGQSAVDAGKAFMSAIGAN